MDELEQQKSALAWVRRQAKELDPYISDNESVSVCTRIIASKIQPYNPITPCPNIGCNNQENGMCMGIPCEHIQRLK